MPGMNNLTGKPMADIAHLSQSIADILTTPLGTGLDLICLGWFWEFVFVLV